MDNYVVYCYLDPRKPGLFLFDDIRFDCEPIYIGKGKPSRPKNHLTIYKRKNTRFYSKIQSIIESRLIPDYVILKSNLTEEKSFEYEKYFIKLIGRIENNGTLTNLSDGGEGQSGFKFSSASKLNRSQKTKGELNPMFGKTHSIDSLKKISNSKIGKPSNKKGKSIKDIFGSGKSIEIKEKMSLKGKERLGEKNPMFNRKHTKESIDLMSKNTIKLFGKDNPNYGRNYKESEKTFDTWELTDMDGNRLIIDNLSKYCKENNLNVTCMRDIYYGRMKKHKQWVKVNKITNNVKRKNPELLLGIKKTLL